jgi:hypothetical protein
MPSSLPNLVVGLLFVRKARKAETRVGDANLLAFVCEDLPSNVDKGAVSGIDEFPRLFAPVV